MFCAEARTDVANNEQIKVILMRKLGSQGV